MMPQLLLLINICIIGALGLICYALLMQRTLKLPDEYKYEESGQKKPSMLLKLITPPNAYLLSRFGNRTKLSWQLQTAGVNMLPEAYLFIKEMILVGLLLGITVGMKKPPPYLYPIAVIIAVMGPDFYISGLRRKRNMLITRTLPDVIDLLYLCVGGGLDFMVGLSWVIARSQKGPLIDELKHVMHDIKMGKPRHEALRDMSKYLRIPQVSSFVNTLVHGERMGSPIVDILSTLAEDARRQRFQYAERKALTAPIKMLFPLIFFILPIVLIIVVGPVMLKFLRDGAAPKF